MSLAVARWGTIAGIGGMSAAAALWLRSLGIFSAGAALVALEASVIPSGAPWWGDLAFDVPPLPVILTLPVAALAGLRWDALAPAIVSSVAAGALGWWLLRALRGIGVGTALALFLTLAAAVHPVWLYAAATGSGGVIAGALLMLGLRLYERWRRRADVLALAGSSFVIAFAGLARYDMFLVGCAVALLLVLRARIAGEEGGPSVGIAYAAGVLGVLGLWVVTNGIVTGELFAFVGRSQAAFRSPPAADPPIHALLVLVPALALVAAGATRRRVSAAGVAAVVVAAAATLDTVVTGSPLSLDAVVPLVPLGAVLLGELARSGAVPGAGAAIVALALVATGAAAVGISRDWGEGHRALVDAARGSGRPMWDGERELAATLRTRSGRVMLDPRTDAVPALLLGAPERVVVPPPVAGASRSAAADADLVVVRAPSGHAAADRVAADHPTLYDGGASWATFVASFPAMGEAAEYRLYRVTGGSR